jgi:cell division protein FtsN
VNNQRIYDNRPVAGSVGLPSGWVVRVGVFQIPENAEKRKSLLDENGFNVNLEETKLDGKTAIRVFLGPFSREEEAERMKAQAVMVTNDKAFVARYP